MATTNISIKPIIVVTTAILLIAIIITNYNIPQSVAGKNSSHTQAEHQQDFSTCVNKSMDKIMNGYLNFSDPDPISRCYDQLFKGNNNGTNNNGGGNNDNNLSNNSSFANV